MELILMIVAFGAIMYFLMIRPQQKRMKEHQALIESIRPGARVLLTSGMFATVQHMGERQAIVELAPGTEITVLKGNIAKVVTPDEEEFEFSDDMSVEGSAADLDPSQFLEQSQAPGMPAPESFDPRPEADQEPEFPEENQPNEGDKS